VKEIYWAFYSRKYDKQREELDAVLGEEETDLASHILHTEWILRARGNHVLGDEYGIWIFSFSEAEKQGADQVLTSSRFECSFSGSEHAADIATASKPGLPVPRPNNAATSAPAFLGDRGKLNAQAYGANTEAILQLETKDASQNVSNAGARDLRTRIASAISQSLCHTLAKESSFLQVGSNNLIDIHSLANTAFEDLEASKATKTTLSLSFGIDWLPPGSLLITYTYSNIARLSRVSQFLLDDQISTKLPTGTAVLMSPSGTIGQYLGVDTTSRRDPLHSSRAELKSSISAHLARIGMFVPSDSQWLRVLLERQSSEGEPNESSNSTTGTPITLWPSRFCLCRDVAAFSEYQNVTKLIDNTTDNIFDPLAKAESWFLSRAKRSKALEVKWQREELEAQRVEEPEETDEEDDLSDFDIQVTRGITPQDASGIYPTPPDGIPSSLPDSSPNNISNHVEPEMEQNAQPIPEAITRPYAEHESGDLFDEIEMDIFTANGLTEADFSFFDEPSPIYEEVQHNNDEMITDDDLGHQVAAETAAVLLPSDNPNPRNTPAEIGNPNATTHLALDNEESAEVPSMCFCD